MKLSIEYRLKNNCGEPHEISSHHSVNHLELLYGIASFYMVPMMVASEEAEEAEALELLKGAVFRNG